LYYLLFYSLNFSVILKEKILHLFSIKIYLVKLLIFNFFTDYLDKRNTQEINLLNSKKVQYLMQVIPYQKVNLLEVKENIIDYKTKSRNKYSELFKSVSQDITPSKFVLRKRILEKTKPNVVDKIISSSLSISNKKFSEYFYKNLYNKFDIDNRIKFAEKRNDLFIKSLSKTKNTITKYENMRNKDEF
jgi:hypothetical protein